MTAARLFVGSFLPESARQSFAELQSYDERLSDLWQCRLRWVHRDKLHQTWCFIGSVEEDNIERVKAALDNVLADITPFDFAYRNIEVWPGTHRPKQLVVTDRAGRPDAEDLAARMIGAVDGFVSNKSSHPFVPHVTLLRFANISHERRNYFSIPDWFPIGERLPLNHHVEKIALVRSYLGRAGAEAYESLHTWYL